MNKRKLVIKFNTYMINNVYKLISKNVNFNYH